MRVHPRVRAQRRARHGPAGGRDDRQCRRQVDRGRAAQPLESFGPVGSAAVVLGVVGMVAGVFRKKKIQPENQRKS
ncbi:hypothetical protein ACFQ0O_33990 [Saccharopolyspora spinosporotrichia]